MIRYVCEMEKKTRKVKEIKEKRYHQRGSCKRKGKQIIREKRLEKEKPMRWEEERKERFKKNKERWEKEDKRRNYESASEKREESENEMSEKREKIKEKR